MKNLAMIVLFILVSGMCIASAVRAVDKGIKRTECANKQQNYINNEVDFSNGVRTSEQYQEMLALCK
jgi:hypothetical protein